MDDTPFRPGGNRDAGRAGIAVQQAQSDNALHVHRVGDLVVDPFRARVTRDGVEVPLPRLSFDVLLALVERAPALVTVDELMARVWAGIVVSPETVSHRIKLLRSALGDDPRRPRYVAVIRGRGYRLIADVERVEDAVTAQPAAPIAEPARPAVDSQAIAEDPGASLPAAGRNTPAAAVTARSRRVVLAGAVALIVAALAVAWLATRDATPPPPSRVALATPERSIAVLPFENVGANDADASLATGVAEAVLHQLASLPEMTVIARSSSFAIGSRPSDARTVGARLGARYLLEGSVQREGDRLRVTAQLVDAETGTHLWSLQFDRAARDVFAVQDEIAAKVANALRVSLEPADARMTTAPRNFDAYLDYLQARSLLGNARLGDLPAAIEALERAVRLDPDFAPAQVALAAAQLQRAEFAMRPGRREQLDDAVQRAERLVARALQLDPGSGEAHLVRARARAFTDLAAAERDYREGLRLAPSDAAGYEGLASVIYQDPRRRDEALTLLDRARRLSPLEPRYDVTKAVFLFFGRSDVDGAQALLEEALQKSPLYPPALGRLGEVYWSGRGRSSEAVRYLEQALRLDPGVEWTRRALIRAYLDCDDEAAARDVIASAPDVVPIRELALLVRHHDWRRAADVVYDAYDTDTLTDLDELLAAAAVRMDARRTGRYDDAIATLEDAAGVTWDAAGAPVIERRLDLKVSATALADVLAQAGQAARSQALLKRLLADIAFESRDLRRGDLWYGHARPQLLAMLGRDDAAIDDLQQYWARGFAPHDSGAWSYEPVFERVRARAEFRTLLAQRAAWQKRERAALDAMRAAGVVPQRPGTRTAPRS